MHILSLGSGNISYLHCANRLHQLCTRDGGIQQHIRANIVLGIRPLLLRQDGYSNPHAPQAEPAETEAARKQRGEEEEFFLQPEEAKEEQERNRMLANDDRYLAHLVQALMQPSPWLLMQMRGGNGPSSLETLD